jgi:hypothetical protein
MRMPPRPFAWLLGFALLASAGAGAQDSTEARLREALRQTAEKLHATEADLAQQQVATAAAEHERDALKQAPHPAKADGALQHRLAETAAELAQARADAQKWQAAQQASAQAIQLKETERAALAGQLAQQRARFERCAANDEALYGTGREIAAMYRDPDFVDHLRNLHLKPFGFARVREENRMRELEDRFAEQHAQMQRCRTDIPSATTAQAAAPTAPAAAAPPAAPNGKTQ